MRLKEIMKEKNLSQNELSRLSSVSQSAIHYILQGGKSPSLSTLNKLAKALDVTVTELIKEEGKAS